MSSPTSHEGTAGVLIFKRNQLSGISQQLEMGYFAVSLGIIKNITGLDVNPWSAQR